MTQSSVSVSIAPGIIAIPVEKTKEWQESYTMELRRKSIQTFVLAVFPCPNALNLIGSDARLDKLVKIATEAEVANFQRAKSYREYHRRMAKKIYEVKYLLQEKRQRLYEKKQVELQQSQSQQ